MNTLENIRDGLADLTRQDFPTLNVPPGPHSYRVATVRGDGRCDLRAVKDGPPAEIPNVDHWSASGASSRPVAGSLVVIAFLDGDPGSPMICAYQPLRTAGGAPTEATLDATTIKIGPTKATLIELGGGSAQFLALASAVASNFSTVSTILAAIGALLNVPGPVAGAAGTVVPFVPASVATTKVKGA